MSRLVVFAGLLAACAVAAAADAPSPTPPTPRPVTLKVERQPLAAVLADVARQSGDVVSDRRGGDLAVSLAVGPTTFWPALDALAAASQSRVDLYAAEGHIILGPRPADWKPAPVSYSGFFRTSVKRITSALDLESGRSQYTAALEVAWEPALLPLYLETSPRDLVVHDDKGRPLPTRSEGRSLAPVDGRLAITLEVPLPAVERGVGRLGLLEGKLAAVAPNKMVRFDFDALDRLAAAVAKGPVRREQDEVVCRVAKVVLEADRWTVQVALDYPPGGVALESFQSAVVYNEMTLQSTDGKRRLSPSDYALERSSPRSAVLSYHFRGKDRGKAADWKVVYATPVTLVETPFTFSFKDVALP